MEPTRALRRLAAHGASASTTRLTASTAAPLARRRATADVAPAYSAPTPFARALHVSARCSSASSGSGGAAGGISSPAAAALRAAVAATTAKGAAPGASGPIGVERVRDIVRGGPAPKPAGAAAAAGAGDDKCGPLDGDDDDDDFVPMVDAATGEWGGPTRGGAAPEPTRYGDWERKGRCTDFS